MADLAPLSVPVLASERLRLRPDLLAGEFAAACKMDAVGVPAQ